MSKRKGGGLLGVSLYNEQGHKKFLVQLLVMDAFGSKRPPNKICAHKDGNKSNCRIDNLMWATKSENNKTVHRRRACSKK